MPEFTKSNTIQAQSSIHFRTPSAWAKEHLYYIDMYGAFTCDNRYRVEREPFDSYLIMYTREGRGILELPHGKFICQPGEAAIVDCNSRHCYYADDYWRFHWFHFNGGSAKAFVRYIQEQHGCVIPIRILGDAIKICQLAEGRFENQIDSEIRVSGQIHQILSYLATHQSIEQLSPRKKMCRDAIAYLDTHYTEPINIAQLAEQFGVSVSGFSHGFKKETGFSPYEFLLNRRFEQAKRLLCLTDLSIGEIAFQVGFQSDAHFIKLFRQRYQQTPAAFRKGYSKPK